MSTHNIGFYEELTKIIFELSSNIIKYAPYFFCWNNMLVMFLSAPLVGFHMSLIVRKPALRVSDQVQHKPG